MDIDYEIVKSVRELEREGHDIATIEEKLGEMGFSEPETKEIMVLAEGVDSAERGDKGKTALLALGGGFVALVVLMAVYAIFFA